MRPARLVSANVALRRTKLSPHRSKRPCATLWLQSAATDKRGVPWTTWHLASIFCMGSSTACWPQDYTDQPRRQESLGSRDPVIYCEQPCAVGVSDALA